MGKLLFDNLLNITLKKDMRYLSIDFGTVLTKAAVYETTTKKLVLVQMNEDDGDDVGVRAHNISYEMPTAVFFDNNSQKWNKPNVSHSGLGLKYSYDSYIGPIGLTAQWSDINRKVSLYFSIGYDF